MFWRHSICAALTAVLPASALASQGIQNQVEAWQADTAVLGIAVAVSDGEAVTSARAGLRSEGGEMLQAGDRFSSASVSKTFTAAAILRLVDQGALSLDDNVSSASGLGIGAELTIADLLTHRSGIPEYIGGALSFETFLTEHANGRSIWTGGEVLEFASAQDGQADSDFAYSNANYALLGRIVEQSTGQSLGEALRDLVFDPAGLTSADLIDRSGEAPDALGYSAMLGGALGSAQFDARLAAELASLGHAAGGVMLSVEDLARWSRLWFSGDFVDGQVFGAPSGGGAFGLGGDGIRVGYGAFEARYGERILRLHGGDGLGVTALAAYDPETGRAIAIVQNDDTVRSLGFGQAGYLDALAVELLAGRWSRP